MSLSRWGTPWRVQGERGGGAVAVRERGGGAVAVRERGGGAVAVRERAEYR